jgi:dTDP-4-amino-4,6-dideoxygalactose transaminase
MASMLANIGPGDEVILPSYTFTSAATAVTKFGGVPVFVDIEAHTKGIDVNQVREAITPKTKAISWVNYAGVAPDIEGLQSIAKEFNLLLIEDNAHGLGGTYKGTPLGSFGDFATQSFHATKNIQCGEGGALIINNLDFKERAEIIREKGTDRSKLMRGEVQKYQWIDQGSSYLLAEVLCAILLGQLEFFSNTQSIRQNTWEAYLKFFTDDVCQRFELEPNSLPNFSTNASHMFYLTANSEKKRERLRVSLNNHGLQVVSHYVPLGNSKAGRILGRTLKMPIESQKLSNSILRFPLFVGLEIETVFTLIDRTFREM